MAIKAGVWIDHNQAIVVLVTNAGQEIKRVKSDLEASVRNIGRSSANNSYTKNDYFAEDRLDQKLIDHRKKYFDEVIACMRGAEAILILGPGEAKGELNKRIKTKKVRVGLVEVETTDKMTERQLAAKVGEHFAKTPAKKSVAPKKTAKKKVASATTGKQTKKSGK